MSFGQSAYTVAESDDTGTANVMENTVEVTVTLSDDPERTVTIPIEATDLNGATADDYSGVPQNVTFTSGGNTSMPFTFAATQDTVDDDGESVRLSFGAMPDARVSEGSPDEATVNIRQFSTEFTLDCMASVWCADLQFSDQSKLDWGWAQLEHGNRRDPESSLSDDSFSFRGVEYEVRGLHLNAGTYPTLANAWSREEQGRSKLGIIVTPVGQSSAPSRGHYRDWVLHMGGLELPFKDVVHSQYGIFLWIDADLQQLFSDWTPTTVNKVGIQEVAAVDQLPSLAVPWLPMAVEAHGGSANKLLVSWLRPHWRLGIPAPTGYVVQWKLASASWGDQAAVSEHQVRSGKGGSLTVGGLTENMLYSVRIFAFNDAGDGPMSDDTLARIQGHRPRLESMSVNGSRLTMRYREQMDSASVPATSSFVVLVEAGLREVTQVEVSGREVILTLASPVHADNYVQARYEEPNDQTATFLRDINGNHVETTIMRDSVPDVVNETPRPDLQPLTAEFSNLPASHNGSAAFTFNVDFSDQVWISHGLPRDDMLEVVGGTVISAHPDDRSTDLWKVTVLPETYGDVSITLPGGYCNHIYDYATASQLVPGAPCAAGDRTLSNQPTSTVPGPESMN